MTTADALTNPLSAPPPPVDITSLTLFKPTLAIKMAGHAVAGVLLRCRPRAVSLDHRNSSWGSYRLDPRDAKGDRAAMVALGGYAALTIAESMNEPMSRGFKESSLCTDLYLAVGCLPGDALSRQARVLSLLPRVHELLLARWPTVQAVATHLLTHRQIDGSTLGRIVRAVAAAVPPPLEGHPQIHLMMSTPAGHGGDPAPASRGVPCSAPGGPGGDEDCHDDGRDIPGRGRGENSAMPRTICAGDRA